MDAKNKRFLNISAIFDAALAVLFFVFMILIIVDAVKLQSGSKLLIATENLSDFEKEYLSLFVALFSVFAVFAGVLFALYTLFGLKSRAYTRLHENEIAAKTMFIFVGAVAEVLFAVFFVVAIAIELQTPFLLSMLIPATVLTAVAGTLKMLSARSLVTKHGMSGAETVPGITQSRVAISSKTDGSDDGDKSKEDG